MAPAAFPTCSGYVVGIELSQVFRRGIAYRCCIILLKRQPPVAVGGSFYGLLLFLSFSKNTHVAARENVADRCSRGSNYHGRTPYPETYAHNRFLPINFKHKNHLTIAYEMILSFIIGFIFVGCQSHLFIIRHFSTHQFCQQ